MRLPLAPALLVAGLLSSCAAPLPPPIADLSGTSWHVVSVNGRQTPAIGDYSMKFDTQGGLGARFGCNSMGGSYRLVGGTLTVGNLNQTLMGCPEPAASFERDGSAILARPMQVAFTSDERMGLSNAAGSIGLVPALPVTAADLQGTWDVVAINGVATPGGQSFRVAFTADWLEGRFGCNRYRSIYSIEGGRFRPVHGSYTEMACEITGPNAPSVPVMQLEEWAFEILRSGPEVRVGQSGTLSLISAKGTIELRRVH